MAANWVQQNLLNAAKIIHLLSTASFQKPEQSQDYEIRAR
jgi:hypothetical protein